MPFGLPRKDRHRRSRRGAVSIEYIGLTAAVAAALAAGGVYARDNGASVGKALLRPVQQVTSDSGH